MTGPMAKTNPFRFSTKFQDDETDLLYYGYRYYNASTGRWLSRDPVNELDLKNIYCFVGNNPGNRADKLGQITIRLDETQSTGKTVCGAFHYEFDYYLDSPHDEPGYIVQEITIIYDIYRCNPLFPSWWVLHRPKTVQFWEFVETSASSQAPLRAGGDTSSEMRRPFTLGTTHVFGQARWYPKSVTGELHGSKNEYTDEALSIKPLWWDSAAHTAESNGERVAWREIYTAWNCCCSDITQTIFVDPAH